MSATKLGKHTVFTICSAAAALFALGCSSGSDAAIDYEGCELVTQTLFDFTVANDRDLFKLNDMAYVGTYGHGAVFETTGPNPKMEAKCPVVDYGTDVDEYVLFCAYKKHFFAGDDAPNLRLGVNGGKTGDKSQIEIGSEGVGVGECSDARDVFADQCGDGGCPDGRDGKRGDDHGGDGNGDGNGDGDGDGNGTDGGVASGDCPPGSDCYRRGGDANGGCPPEGCPSGEGSSGSAGGGCPPEGCNPFDILNIAQPYHLLNFTVEATDGDEVPVGSTVAYTMYDSNMTRVAHSSELLERNGMIMTAPGEFASTCESNGVVLEEVDQQLE